VAHPADGKTLRISWTRITQILPSLPPGRQETQIGKRGALMFEGSTAT